MRELFDFKKDKAIEAILFVLSKRPSFNRYNLLKIMFEADKNHFINHGRPITGDDYIAMEYGTVPSSIDDILKKNLSPDIKYKQDMGVHVVYGERNANERLLSKSDKACLLKAIEKYGDLDFRDVCYLNHKENAWKKSARNKKINIRHLSVEDSFQEDVDELEKLSEYGMKVVL